MQSRPMPVTGKGRIDDRYLVDAARRQQKRPMAELILDNQESYNRFITKSTEIDAYAWFSSSSVENE